MVFLCVYKERFLNIMSVTTCSRVAVLPPGSQQESQCVSAGCVCLTRCGCPSCLCCPTAT